MKSAWGALLAATVAVTLATGFVAARADQVGIDGFVGAGTLFAAEAPIRVTDGGGYDGQFYYRMALAPFDTSPTIAGVEFDRPAYRQQRILYPVIAYTLEALTPIDITQALVFVNIAALGFMVYFAARIGQLHGRSPLVGLLLLAWPPFLFTLALDLAELLSGSLIAAATYLALKQSHTPAAALLAAAVLTRETSVVLAVAALLITRRAIYILPGLVLAAWHLAIWAIWGVLPVMASVGDAARSELALPFVGFVEGISHWSILDTGIFFALISILWTVRNQITVRSLPGLAVILYGGLMVLLAEPVWLSWRGWGRAAVELVLMLYVLRMAQSSDRSSESVGLTEPPPPASAPV